MDVLTEPLVSVIIPVYNGADYLQECLESLLAQTYRNWVAVVANNCSTDSTGEVAKAVCSRDSRVKLVNSTEFVSQPENYNRALSFADPGSKYIKILEADNCLMAECLARMVATAETDAQVGMVGCYYLHGRKLLGAGLPLHASVVEGARACRMHLLEDVYFFGTPTCLLFRAQALPQFTPAFTPGYFHDDTDLCFRILRNWKFGFVHQVLAFIRDDNEGLFSKFVEFGFRLPTLWLLTTHYGADYLTAGERQGRLAEIESAYRAELGRSWLWGRSPAYWEFHHRVHGLLGRKLNKRDLIWPAAKELANTLLNPKSTVERFARRFSRRGLPAGPVSSPKVAKASV